MRAASASTLKFVPYADLALLDPLVSAFVTRNHVMMMFDTLFALDANGDAQPQMLAGYTVEDGAKTWKLTLREPATLTRDAPRRDARGKARGQALVCFAVQARGAAEMCDGSSGDRFGLDLHHVARVG